MLLGSRFSSSLPPCYKLFRQKSFVGCVLSTCFLQVFGLLLYHDLSCPLPSCNRFLANLKTMKTMKYFTLV